MQHPPDSPDPAAAAAAGAYIITGGSRGIGYEIVRGIAKQNKNDFVIFTGRDEMSGTAALEALRSEQINNAHFVRADIADTYCGKLVLDRIPEGMDVLGLVNNAAINVKDPNLISDTLASNVIGPRALTEALLPRMRTGAKVVNMVNQNSVLDSAADIPRSLLGAEDFDAFDAACRHCIEHFFEWGTKPYTASKLLLAALTRVQSLDPAILSKHISVLCCDPGWCRTDMTKGKLAPLSATEGADTPVWLLRASEATSGSGIYFQKICYGWEKEYR
jgi:NAD(P)-dependent dehydrogenase (short-subunit alcohol dehydrogenase family)